MLKIRKAQAEDCEPIYNLRNDEEVLKYSFNTTLISYQDHSNWFSKALESDSRKIFVVTSDEIIHGVVRYDLDSDKSFAEVSIFIDKNCWGKGIGTFALLEGEKLLLKDVSTCKKIKAKVFHENTGSSKLFEKCDYKPVYCELEKEFL